MKKLLLLFTLIVLSSCSHDEDKNEEKPYGSSRYMDPPSWIQGTWMDDHDRVLKFTDSDLFYKYPMQKYSSVSNEIYSYEKYYWDEYQRYQNPNVQETELIDYYSIKYNCLDAPSKKISFTRISDTQIESTGIMPGIYTKQ